MHTSFSPKFVWETPTKMADDNKGNNENEEPKDRYVTFVVHGIGSPKSASIQVDDATHKFAKTWGQRNRTELKRTLYMAHPDHGDSIEYSVFEGRLEDGSTQEIVETQWADLSKTPSGFFSTVTSFIILLLDLRNISKVCKHLFKIREEDPNLETSKRGSWARWWGHYTIGFVEGPIVGLNLLLIAAFLVAIALKTPGVETAGTEWLRGLYVTLFGAAAIAMGLGYQPSQDDLAKAVKVRLPRNRKIWSGLLAVFVVLYWVFDMPEHAWAAIMTGILGMVLSYITIKLYPSRVFLTNTCAIAGLTLTGIAAASTIMLPILVNVFNGAVGFASSFGLNLGSTTVALDTSFFDGFYGYVMIILTVLGIAWFGVNVVYFWVSVGWFARRDRSGMANKDCKTSFLPRTFDLQIFAHIFELRLWLIFIPVIWTLLLRVIPKSDEPNSKNLLESGQIESLIEAGAAFNILNLAVFGLIVICGGITFSRFNKKTKAGDKENKVRLIIGNPVLTVTILSPILFALPFIIDVFVTNGAIVEWLRNQNHIGWAILIAIGAGAFWQREGIKNGIDFALDVTMYFNKEMEVREDKDKGEGKAVVYDKIISRMKAIVDDVINRRDENNKENRPLKVLFLTHSQGTALTRHFLAEQYDPQDLDSYFVTMGSPISHIYQNYFLTALWHDGLNPNLMKDRDTEPARWFNMNRKSDYIGRRVDEGLFNVENVANDAVVGEHKDPWHGGHTGYFVDEVVHRELENRGVILKSSKAGASIESVETASSIAQDYSEAEESSKEEAPKPSNSNKSKAD